MTVTFLGLDRIGVVHGGLNELAGSLETGRFEGVGGDVMIVAPATGADVFFLFTFDDLYALLELADRGGGVRAALERFSPVPSARADESPEHPAVVLDAGELVGAWVLSDLAEIVTRGSEAYGEDSWREGHRGGTGGGAPGGTGDGAPAGEATIRRTGRRGGTYGAAPAGTGGGALAGEATIRRTPHLDAPDEIGTERGTSFKVTVRTDTASLRPEEEGTDVVIDAPPDVTSVTVGVVLTVTEHFVLDDDPYRPLRIERNAPDSAAVTFDVHVADQPCEGNAGIQAVFLYRGRPCGQVGREWDWNPVDRVARPVAATPSAPTSAPIYVQVKAPDLSVVITAPVNNGTDFQCLVETPLLEEYRHAKVASFALPIKAHEFVTSKLAGFIDPGKTPAQRRNTLEVAGYEFFDAAPPLFKEVLWALVDAGRKPKTIYIASVEPTLPWELMIPNRPPNGKPSTLKPLGVEFAVGRWTRADSKSPPQLMPVRNSFVVAPAYEGRRKLETAAEVELLQKRLHGERVQPATFDYLKYHFDKNHASLLHFACHGAANVEDDDAIYLDKDEVLRSGEVRASPEFQALCAQRAPFVFINACETGQMVPSLAGGAGFPFAFGMIGARAIVAPLWPVDDTLADEVATEIYDTALKPDAPPLAEIIRAIRARAYERPDADTYAAYCFYGDPLAKLELVES